MNRSSHLISSLVLLAGCACLSAQEAPLDASFHAEVRPALAKYCFDCHSAKKTKGDLDLERFASLELARKDVKAWQALSEMLEAGEMPPKEKPQPSAAERKKLQDWARAFLDGEALAHAGDPGPATLRRLSHAEYDATIRDLTGLDLHPTREFPADGAAGEGFTNASEALSLSTGLFEKYIASAKEIASHAVLMPDSIRFAPGKTRQDWTIESVANLRAFYQPFAPEGNIPLQAYLKVLLRHRDALRKGSLTWTAAAAPDRLSPKYLEHLWQTLTSESQSLTLNTVRERFVKATEKDAPSLAADIAAWQQALWTVAKIGSYVNETRQLPNDPKVGETQTLKVNFKAIPPKQAEVTLVLSARDLFFPPNSKVQIEWHVPRFTGGGKPDLLLRNYRLSRLDVGPLPPKSDYGLPEERFSAAGDLIVPSDAPVRILLPTSAVRDREFVVEAKVIDAKQDSVFQLDARIAPFDTPPVWRWDGKSALMVRPGSPAVKGLLADFADFRQSFPLFTCFPHVIAVDEVVCLKRYHREDEPLLRLFLDDEQKQRIERLWDEHRFISRFPTTENEYLPMFIGFVTQDQPKELVAYFEAKRPFFKQRAEMFDEEMLAAESKHLDALQNFAARAYKRPLPNSEQKALGDLYRELRSKGMTQDDAIQNVLARVLMAPAFLFHLENRPAGKTIQPIDDWDLAHRLSYFLWSSIPDEALRQAATTGKLKDPKVLQEQTLRMLKDDRVRALAVEFGTQWLHVRGFRELREKNEHLFPTFDEPLRAAIDEESVEFFIDFFANDRPVRSLLDADATYLNEALAKHYGIPGISGPQWRRVTGVRKFGRGGILGLASIQSKESGASRTSPVLRGNWVVETLLGEKLPRPPPDVPKLPEEEKNAAGKTMRQLVEQHVSAAQCAVCHQRIDPFGFAMEKYDPIGRFREKDANGAAVETDVQLKDGTRFAGLDGLRDYLLTQKKDVVIHLFCRRLLGYALGRATMLSDRPLIEQMAAELDKNDGRITAAILTLVRSTQFRSIRGTEME